MLGVIDAGQGSVVRHDARHFALRFKNVDSRSIVFTDRPVHRADQYSTGKILRQFFRKGLAHPNAAVRLDRADRKHDVMIFELSRPRYNAEDRTLRVQAKLLLNPSPGLEGFRRLADPRLPSRFKDATVFLDNVQLGYAACHATFTFPPGYSGSGSYGGGLLPSFTSESLPDGSAMLVMNSHVNSANVCAGDISVTVSGPSGATYPPIQFTYQADRYDVQSDFYWIDAQVPLSIASTSIAYGAEEYAGEWDFAVSVAPPN